MTITASGQRVIMGYSSKTDQKKQHGNVGSSAGKRGKAGVDILKRFVQQRSRHASGNSSEPVKEYGNDAPNGVRRDLISLSDLNSRLWRSLSLEHGLDEILAAAMKLLGATRGNVQLIYDNTLRIVAQSGFSTPFLNAFSAVRADDDSACGLALRQREQVIIEDVQKDELFAPFRRIAREAGYRAVVSTPVLNWHGTPLGMVSVHFDSPHRPSLQQLAQLDQYIRQAGDFIQRFRTEQELRTSVEKNRAILNATADAIITIDGDGHILTFNRAAERMFGHAAIEAKGQHFTLLAPLEDRAAYAKFFSDDTRNAVRRIHGRPLDLYACRKNGDSFPVRLTVCEVDHDDLYVGSVRDMSEYNALHEEILRIASLEQQRIGQELHDDIQQELAGLGLLAQTLSEALAEELQSTNNDKVRHMAARVAKGIAQTNVRVQMLARGMVPVSIESTHLMSALAELVSKTESATGLACRFECAQLIDAGNSEVATHLYKIVQEAIGNAIKHAHATAITVRLLREGSHVIVAVDDNGTGIHFKNTANQGVGMRLMAHRSGLIGGELIIKSNKDGGASVRCSVAMTP